VPDAGSTLEQIAESGATCLTLPLNQEQASQRARWRNRSWTHLLASDKDNCLQWRTSTKQFHGATSNEFAASTHASKHRDFLDLCEMLQSVEVNELVFPDINLDLLKPEVLKRCEGIWNHFLAPPF
jgi:hypothetical protein